MISVGFFYARSFGLVNSVISVGFKLMVYARFGAVRVWLIMVVFLLFIVIQMHTLLFLYCDFVCRRLYQDYRFVYCFFVS